MADNRLSVAYNGKHCYDIVLEQGFENISAELEQFKLSNRKICIVTDSNVSKLYSEELKNVLSKTSKTVVVYTFEAGESNKNLDVVRRLYEFLIINHFDRNDMLAALGGGVVGDLTGFAAATYLRGIKFIQVPTTLLAMSDSSIGGKTGVDFDAYKNMVGAFHMPSLVYMNLSVLNSLDDRQFSAGFGEVLKHGLIKDREYYRWLEASRDDIFEKKYEYLLKMVRRNCEIKRDVVEKDPTEKGERALLNFGHTLGHAIEKLMNFSLIHGECVGIGMIAAAYISMNRGNITSAELNDMIRINKLFGLPVGIKGLTPDMVVEAASHDKKKDADTIKFILLKSVGDAIIDTTVSKEEMSKAVEFVLGL